MKLKTLSSRIIIFVVIIAFVGAFSEAVFTRNGVRNVMDRSAEQALKTQVNSVSELLAEYANRQYVYIEAYAASNDMKALFETSDAPKASVLAAAQSFTQQYATIVPDFDSMCFTNYDGTAIVHNDPALIGFRNPQETIDAINAAFFPVGGTPMTALSAIVSPASNSVSICVMKTVYKADGTPSGYCTLALKNDSFNAVLDKVQLGKHQVVILSSVGDGSAIYSNDYSQISLPIEDQTIVDLNAVFSDYATQSQMAMIAESIGYEALGLDAMPVVPEVEFEGMGSYKDAATGEKMVNYYRYLPESMWMIYVAVDEDSVYAEASTISMNIFSIALLVCIAMVAGIWVAIRRLTKPIVNVQAAITDVSNYNLKEPAGLNEMTDREDEVGRIAKATIDLMAMLRNTVGVLKNCSDSLNSSSIKLEDTSSQLVDMTSENASVADGLAAGVEKTNAAISSVNDEITKIKELVDNVSDKVKTSEKDSRALIENTRQINNKVQDDIRANNRTLDETVVSMQKALESLEAVEKINELVDAIMEITSQTNLLSLNASIEAARAGEAGKGFAVVAGEIGKLAEQSRDTAENIQKIVVDSNDAVSKVRDNVKSLLDYLKEDVVQNFEEFANQSKEYGEGVGAIQSSIEEIGSSMKTLYDSIGGITREIGFVASTAGENSDGVKSIVAKNEQTGTVTDEISRLAVEGKDNATEMEQIIRKFTL